MFVGSIRRFFFSHGDIRQTQVMQFLLFYHLREHTLLGEHENPEGPPPEAVGQRISGLPNLAGLPFVDERAEGL